LHGAPIRKLDPAARRAIVERHHAPYRSDVLRWVDRAIDGGSSVVHVSCHSFTPALDGKARNADVGLLFDPRRDFERRLAGAWRDALVDAGPPLRVRLNYPYRGTADGLTTTLRRHFGDVDYAGIELEVNQAHPLGSARAWRALRRRLVAAFVAALYALPPRPSGKAMKRRKRVTEHPAGGGRRPGLRVT
jgi:predicted N-formylglutamate amidohydrolase